MPLNDRLRRSSGRPETDALIEQLVAEIAGVATTSAPPDDQDLITIESRLRQLRGDPLRTTSRWQPAEPRAEASRTASSWSRPRPSSIEEVRPRPSRFGAIPATDAAYYVPQSSTAYSLLEPETADDVSEIAGFEQPNETPGPLLLSEFAYEEQVAELIEDEPEVEAQQEAVEQDGPGIDAAFAPPEFDAEDAYFAADAVDHSAEAVPEDDTPEIDMASEMAVIAAQYQASRLEEYAASAPEAPQAAPQPDIAPELSGTEETDQPSGFDMAFEMPAPAALPEWGKPFEPPAFEPARWTPTPPAAVDAGVEDEAAEADVGPAGPEYDMLRFIDDAQPAPPEPDPAPAFDFFADVYGGEAVEPVAAARRPAMPVTAGSGPELIAAALAGLANPSSQNEFIAPSAVDTVIIEAANAAGIRVAAAVPPPQRVAITPPARTPVLMQLGVVLVVGLSLALLGSFLFLFGLKAWQSPERLFGGSSAVEQLTVANAAPPRPTPVLAQASLDLAAAVPADPLSARRTIKTFEVDAGGTLRGSN